MRLLEEVPAHFAIRGVVLDSPGVTVPIERNVIDYKYEKCSPLSVVALPVKITFPESETRDDWMGPPSIERNTNTDLGVHGIIARLIVTEFFRPTLSMGLADPVDIHDVMADADLLLEGIAPPLGLRGILLNTRTTDGDLVFQEQLADYDVGAYRRAGLPRPEPPEHPPLSAVPDVPPAPGLA